MKITVSFWRFINRTVEHQLHFKPPKPTSRGHHMSVRDVTGKFKGRWRRVAKDEADRGNAAAQVPSDVPALSSA